MIKDTFQRVFCVNLDRRPDRWEAFLERLPDNWPFRTPERAQAVDGAKIKPPAWWTAGRGAWGCYRSHLQLIEHCLNNSIDSVLLLEDDAICADDFAAKVAEFFQHLPGDWGMIYLGGQHLHTGQHPPERINDWVYRPYNVNRTHAFALRGDMLQTAYSHLQAVKRWKKKHHIDHHFGQLHQRRQHPIYVPKEWLMGQAEGKSNIRGEEKPELWWNHAARIRQRHIPAVVAVLGQFRGGTSCVAGMIHKLGVSMGDQLKPITKANPAGFFEAQPLGRICRQSFKEPWLEEQNTHEQRVERLADWAASRGYAGAEKVATIGAKHPTLCMMVPDMVEAWPNLRIVCVNRPFAESARSLRRQGWWTPKARQTVSPRMIETRDRDLRNVDRPVLRLQYHNVVADPKATVRQLVQFLDLKPSDEQFAAAVDHVNPELHRVQL